MYIEKFSMSICMHRKVNRRNIFPSDNSQHCVETVCVLKW